MPRQSAGVLVFRAGAAGLEVLLVHPGGPFWAKKDAGAWSLPKGEAEPGEDLLAAARRELAEETGCTVAGEPLALGSLRQPGGKVVHAWAVRGDFDPAQLRSGTFTLEWPPRSGRQREFPEVDRAEWFPLAEARTRILRGQLGFLERLERALGSE
jgi:predicted NUDIX family NTP pyrophosphohydrolase